MKYTAGNIARTAAIALAVVVLGSCSDDLDFGFSSRPSDYISFYVGDDSISSTGMTRGTTTHLVFEDEEWSVSDEGAATRATPITTFDDAGTVCVTAFKDEESLAISELNKTEFSFDQDLLEPTGSPVPWSKAGSVKTTFYAYAPMDFIGTNATLDDTGTQITYTVPDAVAEQKDLLTAKKEVLAANYRQSVPLDFTHALTAVRFKVGFACDVKSISIQGVNNQGTYTIGGDWSGQAGTATYTFTFDDGSGYKHFAENEYLTTDEQTLMLIPQTLPAGAKIVLTKNDDTTIEATIAGNEWKPGRRITYIINDAEPNYIYFDLALGNVTISSTKYSGKVYKNINTTPEVVSISGTHSSNNKYYIFQTSTIEGSPAYKKGWKGEIQSTGLPIEGSGVTIQLPDYNSCPLKSPDGKQLWSDYITGNKHSENIIDLWNDNASAHPLVTQQKRTGSMNKMVFSEKNIDLTIDNIWCSTSINSVADAPLRLNANGSMTLRLKGDNFIHRIIFDIPYDNGDYFKITSYSGDKSEEGSLTVTPNARLPHGGNFDNNFGPITSQTTYGDQYGLSFDGGTVYAATPISFKKQAFSWALGGVGGGSHAHMHMSINGGVLTSVAHSTGAAIGGGGGMLAQGGSGYINITGGRTYAYQYGVISDVDKTGQSPYPFDFRYPVTSTAIGGGSCFCGVANEGNVTISGNAYVYAESVGGIAIGGGSSGGLRGGNSEITITGNPTVIAKSIPGYISEPHDGNTRWVEAGTAIGGGNGGDENKKIISAAWGSYPEDVASGGNATVNIYGGKVYAGSIGGGKNGTDTGGNARNLGSATINITGGEVQGQFIMAAGASTPPTFTMTGGTINNSRLKPANEFYKVRDNGGAVYMEDGTCDISGGTIKNASATKGGAVYIEGKTSTVSFTMSGSAEILNCTSTENGGAIYLEGGDVTINGGTIDGNLTSGSDGGAIYINKGSFTMTNGEISNNHSATRGGGVFITSEETPPLVEVTGGSIHHNTCDTYGGGICVYPSSGVASNVTIGTLGNNDTPNIYNNTAKGAGGGLYANGEKAVITINGGRFHDNYVTPYTPNQDVANEGGTVTLNGGEVTSVNVTYNASGGTFTTGFGTTVRIVKDTNSTLTLPISDNVERSPYTLAGWTDVEGSSTPKYSPGQKVLMNISSDVTLYAVWE